MYAALFDSYIHGHVHILALSNYNDLVVSVVYSKVVVIISYIADFLAGQYILIVS